MTSQVATALPPPIRMPLSTISPSASSSSLSRSTISDDSKARRENPSSTPSRTSSRPPSSLDVVPENYHHASSSSSQPQRGPPPSAYKLNDGGANTKSTRRVVSESSQGGRVESVDSQGKRSSEKGKERAHLNSGGRTSESRPRKAQWIVDLSETQAGAEAWMDGHRVVLALGSVTTDALAPILYNPTFSNTLLLVGSNETLPAIEALLSPSHLMSSPDRTVYPTIQPFTLPTKSNDSAAHALTVLLAQATTLAQQSRSRSRSSSNLAMSAQGRSRHNSFASTASNSPPGTPPIRRRVMSSLGLSAASRRGSLDSVASDKSTTVIPSSAETPKAELPRGLSDSSMTATNDITPRPSRSRLGSGSRDSIMGSLLKLSEANDAKATYSGQGSAFDAVINFVPSMSEFQPQKALQEMLHQAVVVTTGVAPHLARQGGKSSKAESTPGMPISLIHVLPQSMPAPLPSVIESFLLSLLPSFQGRSSREIFGCVVTTPAWLSPFVEVRRKSPAPEDDVSGAEVLLFGGVRCPHQVLEGQGEHFRPRAFLPNWSACMSMPGLVAEARRPGSGGVAVKQRDMADPPSISYQDVKARTPPQTVQDRLASPLEQIQPRQVQSIPRSQSMPQGVLVQRRSKLSSQVASASDLGHSPTTPDLDPSVSSCASSFALGETGSQGSASGSGSGSGSGLGSAGVVSVESRGGSENDEMTGGAVATEEKKKSLTGWFKNKRRSMRL
nr:uncharacterized protein CI109_003015 [Kwoniella shandongensis]KAA5528483.1 hypothetical protein CI109_003015 [Kwoniella shandongensis]